MWTAVTDVGLWFTSSLRYAGSKAFISSFSICYPFIMSAVDVFMCVLIVCCVASRGCYLGSLLILRWSKLTAAAELIPNCDVLLFIDLYGWTDSKLNRPLG